MSTQTSSYHSSHAEVILYCAPRILYRHTSPEVHSLVTLSLESDQLYSASWLMAAVHARLGSQDAVEVPEEERPLSVKRQLHWGLPAPVPDLLEPSALCRFTYAWSAAFVVRLPLAECYYWEDKDAG
jgi:hypothetical protein